MKKFISISMILILSVSLFTFSLFANGSKEEAKKGEDIVIKYWTHEDPNRTRIEEKYIKEFEKMYPNVKVERTTQSSKKMIELVQTAFAAKQGPDIFNISIEDEYSYIVNERVAPINPEWIGYKNNQEIMDKYMDNMIAPVYYEGGIYGLPLELTNWCIFINKKAFKSVGLDPEKDYPKTWEDMVVLSEKLAIRDGDILVRRGFDFRYPYYLVSFVPMVEQLGGKLVSDDNKEAIVNKDAWVKFLTFMQQWGPNGNNLGSPTYKNARKLFNLDDNTVSMALTGLYQEGRIKADNPDFYNSGEWMVVPFPVFKDAVQDISAAYYGHYLMVNSQISEYKQEMAWKLIDYMLSHSEEYLTEVSLIQPTKKLMDSDTFKAQPYSDVFAKDFERGHIVYFAENSAEMQKLIREAVESVMLSQVSPEDAYAKLKGKAQELLDENN